MIEVHSDLFDIGKRLKEIDNRYRVFYNTKKSKFELHIQKGDKVSYLLTFPFNNLDARAITHCYKTRTERCEQIFNEIEESNKKLEREQLYQARKQAENKAEQVFSKAF